MRMPDGATQGVEARWALVGTSAVCLYLIAFRIHDIDQNYPLLGEQIRDWSIAQRSFGDLPWIGPRSLNSGLDIGPVYYWCLWALRAISAPLFGVFPHVGGIAQAVFVTLSDGVLLVALRLRLRSWWLAAAIVVFGATAAPDAALSAVTWNPPIAAAFVKLATAALLWPGAPGPWRAATLVVLAVCAAQCHPSAIFVGIPVIVWTLWTVVRAEGIRGAGVPMAAGAVAIAPWVAPYLTAPPLSGGGGRVSAASSLLAVAADPLGTLRVADSARALSDATAFMFATPYTGTWVPWLLLAGVVALVARVREGAYLAASVAPLVMAFVVFALWQGSFEAYWYLGVVPAAALCCAGLVVAAKGRVRLYGTVLLTVLTVALQPMRADHTWTAARLPAYGPLAAGVRTAAANGIVVRGIEPAFDVPAGMDPLFMYSLAGGGLDTAAPVVLVIEKDGGVRYEPVTRAQP